MFFLSNKVTQEQEHQSSKSGINDTRQPIASLGVCKICLEQDFKLIKPCRCNGSIEHVHEKCMISWIQSQRKQKKLIIKCEICLQPIRYESVSHLIIRMDQCVQNMDKINPCYLALFLACIIIITIFSIILKFASAEFLQSVGRGIIIGGLVFMSLCFLAINVIIIGVLITEKVSNVQKVFNRVQQTTEKTPPPQERVAQNSLENVPRSSNSSSSIESANTVSVSSTAS